MSQRIDLDHGRFRQIIRGKIKQNLRKYVQQGEMMVCVEVKVRTGSSRGTAEEAVTPSKAAKLLETSTWFMAEHFPEAEPVWRIDLVAITLDHTGKVVRRTHIENAIETG